MKRKFLGTKHFDQLNKSKVGQYQLQNEFMCCRCTESVKTLYMQVSKLRKKNYCCKKKHVILDLHHTDGRTSKLQGHHFKPLSIKRCQAYINNSFLLQTAYWRYHYNPLAPIQFCIQPATCCSCSTFFCNTVLPHLRNADHWRGTRLQSVAKSTSACALRWHMRTNWLVAYSL